MEIITGNIENHLIFEILTYLDDQSISELKATSSAMNLYISDTLNNNAFWLAKIENNLGIKIPDKTKIVDWKYVYKMLKDEDLISIVNFGDIDIFSLALDNRFLYEPLYDSLLMAIETGNAAIVELLIKKEYVIIDIIDYNDLCDKLSESSAKVVDTLINLGFDPSLGGQYFIWAASLKGNAKIIERILKDDRVDPSYNEDGITALNAAVYNGNVDAAKALLKDARVDVNKSNIDSRNIIDSASSINYEKIIELLLSYGFIIDEDCITYSIERSIAIGFASKPLKALLKNNAVSIHKINAMIRDIIMTDQLIMLKQILKIKTVIDLVDRDILIYCLKYLSNI
jgi:hypothetical protein